MYSFCKDNLDNIYLLIRNISKIVGPCPHERHQPAAGGTVGIMALSTTSRRRGAWSQRFAGAEGRTRCPCPRWWTTQHSIQIKSLRLGVGDILYLFFVEWNRLKENTLHQAPCCHFWETNRNYNARNRWAERRIRSKRLNTLCIARITISFGLSWPHGVKTPGSSPSLALQQVSL